MGRRPRRYSRAAPAVTALVVRPLARSPRRTSTKPSRGTRAARSALTSISCARLMAASPGLTRRHSRSRSSIGMPDAPSCGGFRTPSSTSSTGTASIFSRAPIQAFIRGAGEGACNAQQRMQPTAAHTVCSLRSPSWMPLQLMLKVVDVRKALLGCALALVVASMSGSRPVDRMRSRIREITTPGAPRRTAVRCFVRRRIRSWRAFRCCGPGRRASIARRPSCARAA